MRSILVLTGLLTGAAAVRLSRQSRDIRRRATERIVLRRSPQAADGGDGLAQGWPIDDWLLWEVELAADRLEQ